MNLEKNLIRQGQQAGWILALTVLTGLAGGGLVLLQAQRLSEVIARVFLRGQVLVQVMPLLAGLLLIFLLRSLMLFLGETMAGLAAVRVKNNLREMLFQKLFALGPAYAQGEHSGELSSTLTQGVEQLDAYFSQYLPQLVLAAGVPLVILLAVFPIDLLSGIILLLTAPLIPIFMVLIGKAAEALTHRQFTALSRMSAFFLDTLQGLTTLVSLGQSGKQAARIATVSERYRSATMAVLRVTFLSALVLELLATLSTAIIAVQIGLRLLYGQVGFEEAFFLLVVAPEFYLPLRTLGLRFHAGMSGVSAARRIFEILDQDRRPGSAGTQPATQLQRKNFNLVFEDVNYVYPSRGQEALAGVSFELHAGEHLALVGPSGSGKTTVAGLLLRFIQPSSGQIRLNGCPIEQISLGEWWANLSWVGQQPYLLHESVAANLRIAKNHASQGELERAAEIAGLDGFIRSLPDGYQTIIGEQGSRLSGGQAQRLALARAFLKDAPLLILDEPTAHLDSRGAAEIQANLSALRQDRTVLTIAHSLPTVLHADRIIVMEHGRVVESGTHMSLMGQGGLYAGMIQAYRSAP